MKLARFARLITCIVVLLAAVQVQAQSKKQRKAIAAANTQIENNLKTFVGILASDSLEGRRTGTTGEAKAVAYIENYYKQLGIAGANNGSYLQPFVVDEGKTPNASQLQLDDHVLKAGVDFFPLPWSGLQNIDAESAAALQEIGSPWWYDLKEDLEANKNNPHLLPEQLIRDKAIAAAKIGATALLVYNTAAGEEVIKYNAKDRSDAAAIPVFYIQKEAVHKYKIDTDASFHVKAKAVFTQQKRNGTNVAAFINNNAAQTIILGAHLDHLGYGEDANSRHTGDAAIHNGADDNASGTAALMEVARLLKEKPNQSFNYLLLHFSGEELGLYGSKFYTEHPLVDFKQVNYMINMDMVGRLNPESKVLTIGGIGTSPAWSSVLKMNEQTDFSIKIDSSGTGPSDHTSFYRKDLPVLFFFTGLHTDYHKPSDDAHLINYSGMRHIVQYISRIIDNTPVAEKLAFTKTKEQQMGGGRFKVSIGIMPDYTFSGQGVKADGIIDGRPAQKAGVQAGDVIIQLGEHLITSVETYMQALNRFDKGQQTTVTIKRGSEIKEFAISF
ncbi:MAG: M28 family peptidase [Chitinophagaceae bacterium]|nr:M28 family peptidase [Chitinophagaceae bacterium]